MYELRMDGPAKNALSSAMIDFLMEGLERAKDAPVLLTGVGDVFSAGLDLKEVAALDATGLRRHLTRLDELVAALFLHPAPTVALAPVALLIPVPKRLAV